MKRRIFVKGFLAVLAVPSLAFAKIKEKFIPKSELRKVEKLWYKPSGYKDVFIYDKTIPPLPTHLDMVWKQCRLKDIKKGDWFRMFEPDGTQVIDTRDGITVKWMAIKDAYLAEDGLWHVDTFPHIPWFHGQGMKYQKLMEEDITSVQPMDKVTAAAFNWEIKK